VAVQLDPASIKVVVGADSNLILQVISNLLSNAVKFFPSGGEVFRQGQESRHDGAPFGMRSGTGRARRLKNPHPRKIHQVDAASPDRNTAC
jgi:hypothetical protein